MRLNITMLLVMMAAVLTSPLAHAAEKESEYLQLVGEADKAASKMKWNEAIDFLQQAMRLEPANPGNILLMSNKGMMHYYNGDDSLALATLTAAHEMAPASVTVLQNRARVLTEMGRGKDAIADYKRVMELDTTLVEPIFYHSMLSFHAGDMTTAREDIALLKQRFPEHESTLLAEGTLLAFTGEFSEAIPLLTKLIAAKPSAADYATRAMCYLMTNQLPEAADDISLGLKKDPTNGELYLYRALLNKLRFRPDDAKADAEMARKFGVSGERLKVLGL